MAISCCTTEGAAEVKRHAQRKVLQQLQQLDAEIARSGGPWFMGQAYSALDPYVFTLCRWTRNFSDQRARVAAPRALPGPHARAPGRAAGAGQRGVAATLRLSEQVAQVQRIASGPWPAVLSKMHQTSRPAGCSRPDRGMFSG